MAVERLTVVWDEEHPGPSEGRPAYRSIRAEVDYAADPAGAGRDIVDLDRAVVSEDGRVRFRGDVQLLQPADPAEANGRLVVIPANRGRAGVLPFGGEALLLGGGWTVAFCGWQWDVVPSDDLVGLDAPVAWEDGVPLPSEVRVDIHRDVLLPHHPLVDHTGDFRRLPAADVDDPDAVLTVRDWWAGARRVVERSRWRFAREVDGTPVADDEHLWVEGGLLPFRHYEVVYRTRVSPVAGVGLLAYRDLASFLRYGSAARGNPCAGAITYVFSHSASQSGRFVRQWLAAGLNLDDEGRMVYDGVQVDVAGARRGEINHRGAQPALMYPVGFPTRPPFTTHDLLAKQRAVGGVPKVVFTNSAWEYWLGDAALAHVDRAGERDLDEPAGTRTWFFAGIDHYGGLMELKDGLPVANRPAVLDAGRLTRAAFANLERWVCDGVEPPPSRVPRVDDSTAVDRRKVLKVLGDAVPSASRPDPDVLPALHDTDLGLDVGRGIARWPAVLGAAWPDLVSAVDDDGNEIAGVAVPGLAVPLGTHTGWNPRVPVDGLPDVLYPRCGSFWPFARSAAERAATGDPRPSIEERYADRDDYVAHVRAAADGLVGERLLLPEDAEGFVRAAGRLYDELTSGEGGGADDMGAR